MIYQVEGRIPERIGNRYESVYPYDSFHTSDSDVVIAGGNDKLYRIICDVIGKPELKTDERFIDNETRKKNHVEMKKIIEEWTIKHTQEKVVNTLLDAGVPAAPIYNLKQVCEDPHISEDREMFIEVEHPIAGKTKLTGCHIKLMETKPSIRKAAPLLGENNEDVFESLLGLTKQEIQRLKEIKAI
jgi:formyl-CoA transferase